VLLFIKTIFGRYAVRKAITNITALACFAGLCVALCSCSHTSAEDSVKDKRISGHAVFKEFSKIQDKDGKEKWLGGPVSILQEASGIFWISTADGIYLYDEKTNQWTTLLEGDKLGSLLWPQFYQSQDDRIWLRSRVTGIVKYFDGRGLQEDGKLGTRAVQAIFNGLAGKLWFVLEDEMVCYEHGNWSATVKLPEGARAYRETPQETQQYLSPEVKRLIERYSKGKQITVTASRANLSTIESGLQDRDGFIWLGGLRGLFRFDILEAEWRTIAVPEKLQGGVYHIYQDRKGVLWFSDMYRDVSLYDKRKDTWGGYTLIYPTKKDYKPSLRYWVSTRALYQDRQGRMMFATSEGLITFLQDQDKWEVFTEHNSGLQDDYVTGIMEDRKGRIWIGTAGGILVLEP
jgi:ligand-binding sensor domain-containing protein